MKIRSQSGDETRRTIRKLDLISLARLILAGAVSVGVVFAAFAHFKVKGPLGFTLAAYALFICLYAVLERLFAGSLTARDRVASVAITTMAGAALVPLVLIIGFVVEKGYHAINGNFFTQTLEYVGPLDKGSKGGALHALLGTLEQVGMATLISVPLGILTGLFLSERRTRFAAVVRFFVDAMSGVPSIVAGLFIFTIYVLEMRRGFSGLAAGLALAVLMLPTVARTSEEMLRLVPGSLREASLALGAPEWRTVMKVVVPAARSGLVTAVVLGVARVAGETAPLLMTAFGNSGVNLNPGKGPQSALPLFIYQQIRNPLESEVARAWSGALVLVTLVLILFTLARALGSRRRIAK